MEPAVVVAAVVLALVHLLASYVQFLGVVPRSRWLSLAGGVSVAYVFVHLFPELARRGRSLAAASPVTFLEHHVYLLALAGFAGFYGLEQYVQRSKGRTHESRETEATSMGVFWLHVASFAVYNALVGYLLVHREEPGVASLAFFTVALALHFLVNDRGLAEHHGDAYRAIGRWVLSIAVLVGFGIGVTVEVAKPAVSALFAFLAGGIVLNVIKEELPAERESRFLPFALGAVVYSALLLAV